MDISSKGKNSRWVFTFGCGGELMGEALTMVDYLVLLEEIAGREAEARVVDTRGEGTKL
jgi:hypothetical protein